MFHKFRWAALAAILVAAPVAIAQITVPRTLSSEIDRFATLEEQLVNRLRATRNDQRGYLKHVVKQVRQGKLDVKLVVAIERRAIRQNRRFPFPFFERALHIEAKKRGVTLPVVQQFATTKNITPGGTK